MNIGTTKELKNHEYRVGLTPDNVADYVRAGHTVYVETHAGEGAGFADADIGAAARAVHAGCKKALDTYLPLTPVRTEAEGSEVVVEADAAQGSVTLTGNLAGEAPFRGQLCHRGWKVTEVKLPEVAAGKDLSIVAPAEVELS